MATPSAAERAALRALLRPLPEPAALSALLSELPDGASVLEVCCGDGAALAALPPRLRPQGIDPDPAALSLARARLGDGVPLREADLLAAPPASADAVLCLSGALCATADAGGLAARCRALAAAARPGGLVIVAPALDEVFQGQAVMQTHDGEGVKIVRSAVTRVRGERCQRDWFWLVARDGQGVVTFEEREVRIAPGRDALAAALAAAGLVGAAEGALWRMRRAEVV